MDKKQKQWSSRTDHTQNPDWQKRQAEDQELKEKNQKQKQLAKLREKDIKTWEKIQKEEIQKQKQLAKMCEKDIKELEKQEKQKNQPSSSRSFGS